MATVNDPIILHKNGIEHVEFLDLKNHSISYYLQKDPDKEFCEDALLIKQESNGLMLAICDGVGSSDRSYRAAKNTLTDISNISINKSSEEIQEELLNINKKLIALEGSPQTTFTMVIVKNNKYICYQVGDSGIIHCGNRGKLKYKSKLHSPIGIALEQNELTEKQALEHPDLNIVDNVMGTKECYIEISPEQEIAQYDTLILTSDGILDNLLTDQIIELISNGDFKENSNNLENICKTNKYKTKDFNKIDDISFICLRMNHT